MCERERESERERKRELVAHLGHYEIYESLFWLRHVLDLKIDSCILRQNDLGTTFDQQSLLMNIPRDKIRESHLKARGTEWNWLGRSPICWFTPQTPLTIIAVGQVEIMDSTLDHRDNTLESVLVSHKSARTRVLESSPLPTKVHNDKKWQSVGKSTRNQTQVLRHGM